MGKREVKDFGTDDSYCMQPEDFGRYALLISIFKNKSCKQAFLELEQELDKREVHFHNTFSRGW